MQINKIDRLKVSDAVFEQLRQIILRQEQPPGSKLPSEKELTQMFGVSRTSVRSAIQRLVSLGMVETRNGDGTYVKKLGGNSFMDSIFSNFNYTAKQVLQILEFRMAIEMLSCRLAAQRASCRKIEELHTLVENMQKEIINNNPKQYSVEDMKFHCCIAEMSDNILISKVIQELFDFYFGHFIEMNDQIDLSFGFRYHVGIYEAIRDGDGDKAESLIKESISRSIGEVQKWEQGSPEHGDGKQQNRSGFDF